MSETPKQPAQTGVTELEVMDFARKLEKWGSELPPRERDLLQFMLARSEGATLPLTQAQQVELPDVATAAARLLRRLVPESGELPKGVPMPRSQVWVRMGKPWIKYVK